jgi:hypothetical protein
MATPPFSRRRIALALLFFALASLALFTRLGHYALWDDEAGTALSAVGIWRTGDTTALLDHNLVAYESGKDLRNLHERLMPPLPGYLTAPFVGFLGRNALAARLPFALCGAACVGLMLCWLLRSGVPMGTVGFFGLALLTNVSFFLFCRQCRYYAVAMLTSVAITWLYVQSSKFKVQSSKSEHETTRPRDRETTGRRTSGLFSRFTHHASRITHPTSPITLNPPTRQLALLSLLSLCLFASNYLNWAALYLCLALDYSIWGRKEFRLTPAQWAILIVPQVVIGGVIFSIWNPLAIISAAEKYPEVGKLRHLWWCVRDVITCEFGSPVFVALGLFLAFRKSVRCQVSGVTFHVSRFTFHASRIAPQPHSPNNWLLRACLCLIVYIAALSLLVQRPPSLRGVAAVRYFTPIIPLLIAISAMSLSAIYTRWRWAAIGLAGIAFTSNLLIGGPLLATGLQSTQLKFVQELLDPPGDPYTATVAWLRANVRAQESVWVLPDFATYPLMFHAPGPTYAWQLTWPPAKEEFKGLAPIHFIGQVPPQYIIGFGPATDLARQSIASWNRPEIQYAQVATIDFFWREKHRPELFWRTFQPITAFDRSTEAIYVFKLLPN